MRFRTLTLLLLVLVGGAASEGWVTASADTGRTAVTAAHARTDRFAKREASLHRTTYTLGVCRLLHRRPWLGYRCEYTIHGLGDQCHDFVTVAVKRLPSGEYNAIALKWYGSGAGAPC